MIIGGLVSSTLLARIVTPVMYKLIAPAIETEESAAEASLEVAEVLEPQLA